MMNRKRFSFKKVLSVCMLIGALLGVQVMEMVAFAAEVQPKVIASNFSQLYSAILQAKDGDIIGIDNSISIVAKGETLGDSDKHVTLLRINESACFEIAADSFKVQNVTFDGNGIKGWYSMVKVNTNTDFENVTFQNCHTDMTGGAIFAIGGNINISDCTFINNSASNGGHISIWNDSKVAISSSRFEGGFASAKGGAIECDSVAPWCSVTSSVICNNSAGICGGGIFNNKRIIIEQTKIYGNTAHSAGADIANTDSSGLQMTESIDDLALLFKDINILPTAWVNDYDFESGITIPGISPELPNSFLKLEYEVIPTEVILAESSLGIANDGRITGLEAGKGYKVFVDKTISYSKSDGTLTLEESEAELLIGTEIIGLTNGKTYMVEEYSQTPEPTDPPEESTPENPDQGKEDATDTPDKPGDEDSKPDQGNEDDNGSQQPDPTPDDKDPNSTPTPNPDTDKKDDATSSPSNNSTSTTDNSSTKDDHSSTKNDYSKTTHTSTVNNHYETEKLEPGSKTEAVSNPGTASQTIVVEKSVPAFSPTETTSSADTHEELSKTEPPSVSTPKNIRIEANGADCVFELNEYGYNISINANSNKAPESVKTETNSVNWYELVKICLMAAIAVTLFWKSKKPLE